MSDLCRREGIKPDSYYSWTKEFMEAGRERLTRDSVRDATKEEVHAEFGVRRTVLVNTLSKGLIPPKNG